MATGTPSLHDSKTDANAFVARKPTDHRSWRVVPAKTTTLSLASTWHKGVASSSSSPPLHMHPDGKAIPSAGKSASAHTNERRHAAIVWACEQNGMN